MAVYTDARMEQINLHFLIPRTERELVSLFRIVLEFLERTHPDAVINFATCTRQLPNAVIRITDDARRRFVQGARWIPRLVLDLAGGVVRHMGQSVEVLQTIASDAIGEYRGGAVCATRTPRTPVTGTAADACYHRHRRNPYLDLIEPSHWRRRHQRRDIIRSHLHPAQRALVGAAAAPRPSDIHLRDGRRYTSLGGRRHVARVAIEVVRAARRAILLQRCAPSTWNDPHLVAVLRWGSSCDVADTTPPAVVADGILRALDLILRAPTSERLPRCDARDARRTASHDDGRWRGAALRPETRSRACCIT